MAHYLSLSEAAKLGKNRNGKPLSAVSLRFAIEQGRLRGTKQGGRNWKVSTSDLASYLKNRPEQFQPRSRAHP